MGMDMSDIDSDTGRRKKTSASRRRKKRSSSGSGGGRAGDGKRPRKSRRSNGGGSSGGGRKKRRTVAAISAAAAGSASSHGRRLVKPHQKKAKKSAAGGDDEVSNVRLLEDTTSSSSEGGGRAEGALRRGKVKNKRVPEKPRTNETHTDPKKKKQGGGPGGSGTGGDLLGALIANPAPARKKTNLSTAGQAAPDLRVPRQGPKLVRKRSADALERRGNGDRASAGEVGSDGRAPPRTAASSLSLSQYRGEARRTNEPEVLPSSSSKKPGKSVASWKAAKAAPNGGVGKKTGAEHPQRVPKTLAQTSGTNTNRDIPKHAPTTTPTPAPSNKIDKYDKVQHFIGVYKKKSNGKYFVWVDGALLDGTPYET